MQNYQYGPENSIISWFLTVIFQSCFHSSWAENHLSYHMCVVGHILLYSCKVTQFPDFPREFIHFPGILCLKYTSLNSPVSERAAVEAQRDLTRV